MDSQSTIYILGSGAVGFPLAAFLADAGRRVIAVRTSRDDIPRSTTTVSVQSGSRRLQAAVETVSLSGLAQLDGTIVVAAKAYANTALARALSVRQVTGPLVILQNGVGVEQPFVDAGLAPIYRCVLYVTSQSTAGDAFSFRAVNPSPIGVVAGSAEGLERCVDELSTDGFPFRAEAKIEREVWRKAIVNVVFNSVCPLLDVDNGIFARDAAAAAIARALVAECVALTDRLALGLSASELLDNILLISERSDGQLISTLQDIRAGRETEIASLNLEIARIAASLRPSLQLPQVTLLGNLILAKSRPQRSAGA